MIPRIQRHLIWYPARALMGDRIWQLIPELAVTERMSRNELDSRTHRLLGDLLRRAYEDSPFFRERLAIAGYSPDRGYEYDPERFRKIAPLTKPDVRDYMTSGEIPNVSAATRSTSGSTGEPLVFKKDRIAANYMDAAMHQVYSWHGIDIGDREGRFWGTPIPVGARLKQQIRDHLLNRRRLSAFAMDERNCERFWKVLCRFRPHYFYCYPSAVFEFADYLQRTGRRGYDLGLKAIICTGEVFFPHHEALLREVFHCPIVNEYGSTENGIIALTCSAGKMHVLEQNIFLEIVDEEGNPLPTGKKGRILVTELQSRHVPFIRYALGDEGTLSEEPCPCGRVYSVLSVEIGRIDSFIVTPEGKKVYDAVLAYAFKHSFRMFRGYQRRQDLLEIDYVPAAGYDESLLGGLRRKLQEYLGADMHVEFRRVNEISPSRSGKMQYFVSELPLKEEESKRLQKSNWKLQSE
jgi:phenylacetate-CoA ligase